MNDYTTYSETDLINCLKCNDETAFREIYRRYGNMLRTYSFNITGNVEDASDILQEVLVDLWKRRNLLDDNLLLKSYLYKAVRNQSLKMIHKCKKKFEFLQSFEQYVLQAIAHRQPFQLEYQELSEKIHAAILSMPEKMRAVFVLSREQQLSHKEIAKALNITESTAKKHVQNALKFIKKQINLIVIAILALLVTIFC
jgi:RNA polymerase sigma-70 factor (family 1)